MDRVPEWMDKQYEAELRKADRKAYEAWRRNLKQEECDPETEAHLWHNWQMSNWYRFRVWFER